MMKKFNVGKTQVFEIIDIIIIIIIILLLLLFTAIGCSSGGSRTYTDTDKESL
jgi:competence protein ComGC